MNNWQNIRLLSSTRAAQSMQALVGRSAAALAAAPSVQRSLARPRFTDVRGPLVAAASACLPYDTALGLLSVRCGTRKHKGVEGRAVLVGLCCARLGSLHHTVVRSVSEKLQHHAAIHATSCVRRRRRRSIPCPFSAEDDGGVCVFAGGQQRRPVDRRKMGGLRSLRCWE